MSILTYTKYVSDITGETLDEKDVYLIKHRFWWDGFEVEGLPLNIHLVTTKKELEFLFWKKIRESNPLKDFITGEYIFDFMKDSSFFDKSHFSLGDMKYISNVIANQVINLEFHDERKGTFYISLTPKTFKKYFWIYLSIKDII